MDLNLINHLPAHQRSQLSSTFTSSSSTLQHSPFVNLSIPPIPPTNAQSKNTSRLKPTTESTRPILCTRLLEITIVPSAPFTNTPEKPVLQDHPSATETAQRKPERKLKSLNNITSGIPRCRLCGKQNVKICTGCEKAWYCSQDCHSKDWLRHREFCLR